MERLQINEFDEEALASSCEVLVMTVRYTPTRDWSSAVKVWVVSESPANILARFELLGHTDVNVARHEVMRLLKDRFPDICLIT